MLIVGVYTGHNCLNRHLRVLGLINSPKCSNCNVANETALHYLCYCSHYGAVRTRIWGKPFLHPSKVPHITVRDLLRFLASSRRFSQYPSKKYQGLYWRTDYGPICGLVLRRSTFTSTETTTAAAATAPTLVLLSRWHVFQLSCNVSLTISHASSTRLSTTSRLTKVAQLVRKLHSFAARNTCCRHATMSTLQKHNATQDRDSLV